MRETYENGSLVEWWDDDAATYPRFESGEEVESRPYTTVDPDWVQPSGAHDAYQVGDRVTYLGQDWECTSAANVYAPGVFGWSLI